MPCLDEKSGCCGCSWPAPLAVDLLWASGACQPCSAMRRGVNSVSPEKHEGWSVTFGETDSVLDTVRRLQPNVFGSEQVLGFLVPYKGRDGSPKDDFMHAVMSVKRDGTDDAHFVAAACMKLDSGCFIQGARPRRAERDIRITRSFFALTLCMVWP